MSYPNLSPQIGAVISHELASLYELQTIYGAEDLFDLYEVILVKLHNENIIFDRRRKK